MNHYDDDFPEEPIWPIVISLGIVLTVCLVVLWRWL